MSIKEYKIQILSVLVMVLVMSQVYPKNIINVSVYLEGDKANMATVVDLSLDYNENNLNLISYSPEGILKTWDAKRFLLMPNSNDFSKPIIKLKFKTNNFFTSENIKIATESQVYLSDIGITSLPSDKINIRLDYEQ
ncbi:MAG: hypothetical protein Q7T59_02700 [Candidatus Woesebacteria bacterium]|nr:hypothetical protein [Candidatus Woesebacteria bacterium]